MMHSKKVILVPEEFFNKPGQQITTSINKKLQKITKDKKTPMDVKMIEYNQLFQKYNKLLQAQKAPVSITINEPKQTLITDDYILQGIPKTSIKNAKMLLQHIHDNPSISIDDKGEITIHGQKLYGSNIIDVINDLTRKSKTRPSAIGAEELGNALQQSNMPLEYIGNVNRRRTIEPQIPFEWVE